MSNCESCCKKDVCKFREDMEAANERISKVVEESGLNVTCELKCGYYLDEEVRVVNVPYPMQANPFSNSLPPVPTEPCYGIIGYKPY